MPEGTQPTEQQEVQTETTEVETPITESGETSDVETEVEQVADDATETQSDEEETDYLPDEQSKVFPVDVLAKYAKRYGYTLEEIQGDPRLQNALKDKINSDILIAKNKAQAEVQDEPTEEEEAEETTEQPEAQKMTPEQRQQWTQSLQTYVAKKFDPDAVKGVGDSLLQSLGYAKDQYKPEVAKNFGSALAVAAVDLFNTMMSDPDFGARFVQSYIPQPLAKVAEREVWSNAWDGVKASDERFAELPGYGTKEFSAAVKQFKAENPWYEEAVQKGLSPKSQAQMLAKHLSGQKVTPPAVKQAFEKGKQAAEQASRSAKLGKLGAGKPTGQFAPKNQGDDFRSAIERYNQSQRSTGK